VIDHDELCIGPHRPVVACIVCAYIAQIRADERERMAAERRRSTLRLAQLVLAREEAAGDMVTEPDTLRRV
jgi:hypothetical protein